MRRAERVRAPDHGLWREFVRDIAPLRAPARRPASAATEEPGASAPASTPALPAAAGPGPAASGQPNSAGPRPGRPAPREIPPLDRLAGIDRANAERLKRGKRAIDARLDLHGMTRAEAHEALSAFVAGSRRAGLRCVLVITGRGGRADAERTGILKSAVPRWLEEPGLRRHVLAIAAAQPRHGGAGALYVLLRRER